MKPFQLLLGCALLAVACIAQGQPWPNKPVKIVVPYPPGGSVDAVTRRMAAQLQQQTGQSFFVENKAGGTGTIGLAQVAASPADGYTLVANDTTYALLPHIFKKLPFDYDQALVPAGAFIMAPMTVAVRTDSRFKTLGDLLTAARSQPGTVTYGTGGAGSTPHFSTEALAVAAGVKFLHVPFKGAGEATLAVLSSTIDFQIASTPGVISQVKGGKMRLLAVGGETRLTSLPQVPTFVEAGVKGYSVVNFTGLWAPRGVPAEMIMRLQKEIGIAMNSPGMKAYADSIGAEAAWWDASTLARNLADKTAYWAKVAANANFEKQ